MAEVGGTVELDGSEGEGGGQVLRSALSLSLITQRPFRITKIRAKRKQPGLRPQHLACVRGAEAISASRSEGAEVGASELSFVPGPVRPGNYEIDVGTAGSTALLLQCLYYPLALAGRSQLVLRGGTHVSHSPTFHYLAYVWSYVLAAYGLDLELHLKAAGFYPQGAGEIRADIDRVEGEPPVRVVLPSRGSVLDVDVASFVSGLPFELAERQGRAAVQALRERGILATTENLPLPSAHSKGTAVVIRAQFENTIAGFSALGERGVPAEDVGRGAAKQFAEFIEGAGALDEHQGDQILLPAALLAAGRLGAAEPGETRYTAARVTDHLTTNAAVLQKFLPVAIDIRESGEVTVRRA